MSTISEIIEVTCPRCGERFADWLRHAVDPATSATCPRCGYRLADDETVRTEGAWIEEDDPREVAR